MNIKAFSKEIADYFNLVLNDADMKRIAYLVEKYNEPIIRETIVYKDRTITKPVVKNRLVYVNLDTKKRIDFDDIISLDNFYNFVETTAATMWNIDKDLLYKKDRRQPAVWARFMCYMKYSELGIGCVKIANRFNRDHTTIIYGCQEAQNMLDTNAQPFCYIYRMFNDKIGDPFQNAGYSVIEEEDLMKAV